MSIDDELVHRAKDYAQRRRLTLGERLGAGVHGIVFVTESQPEKDSSVLRSAIKVHERGPDYLRERDVYLRLRERGIVSIRGCRVPRLLQQDDDLWVLEMTV